MNIKPINDKKYSYIFIVYEYLNNAKPNVRHSTYSNYSHRLHIFLDYLKDKGIVHNHVKSCDYELANDFNNYLVNSRKIKDKTRLEYNNLLKMVYGNLLQRKIVEENPFVIIKVRKNDPAKPQKWTIEQLKLLHNHFADDKAMIIIINLLFYCYIRPKEIFSLKRENIDLQKE